MTKANTKPNYFSAGKNGNGGKKWKHLKRNKTQQVETCWACCQV
jgi:hypothetical protein